ISKAPNLNDFEALFHGELSGTENGDVNYVARGILNIPIVTGKMGLRVGVETLHDSGFVDHATDGVIDRTGINGDRGNVLKAMLTYDVTDALTISANVFTQRMYTDDTGLVDLATPNYITTKKVAESGRDTMAVSSLKVNYDLDWADLTSVTSYAWRQFPRITD